MDIFIKIIHLCHDVPMKETFIRQQLGKWKKKRKIFNRFWTYYAYEECKWYTLSIGSIIPNWDSIQITQFCVNYSGTVCKFCANYYLQFLHTRNIWPVIFCCSSNEILMQWSINMYMIQIIKFQKCNTVIKQMKLTHFQCMHIPVACRSL